MSYEGYEQFICKNGHYWTAQCSYYFSHDHSGSLCSICGEKEAWRNSVDETNCYGVGYIPPEKLLTKEAETKTCDMGHAHIVTHAVYRIPSQEETKLLQTWRKELDEKGSLFTLEGDKDTGLKMFKHE